MPNEIVSFDNRYQTKTSAMSAKNQEFLAEQGSRMLVENLPVAMVRYDRDFRRIYTNPTYRQVMMYEGEVLGKSINELWWATNMSAESYRAILEMVMRSGDQFEVTLEWKDGEGRQLSYIKKLIAEFDASGQTVVGVMGLGIDVSAQRQQQLVESKRQRVFERLAHGDDLADVLKLVAYYVESARPGAYCSLVLLDEEQRRFQAVTAPSFPETHRAWFNSLEQADANGLCKGWISAAMCGERVIVEDFNKYTCSVASLNVIHEMGIAACWAEPIFSTSRQLLAVLSLYLKQTGPPDQNDLTLLHQAAQLSSLAIERKRFEQKIYSLACYDPLTGLPNRRLFNNRLHEEIVKAERGAYGLAVLFIDLDCFKEVNDTWGHEAGDGLLVDAAQRIQSCVRESDTVARLGGDEFVVILPEVCNLSPLERVAQNIVSIMQRPFYYGERSANVSASIGIAVYPEDAGDEESLVSCADQAMYVAKEAGRNRFSIFTHRLSERERQRWQLSNDLRCALGNGQLEVYYQPIVDVCSGETVKAEALLRWHHHELGAVRLDYFLPIAEETDMIHEIGAWVFQEAIDTAKRWNALKHGQGPKQIAVNMSTRQFIKGDGDQLAIEYLRAAGLDAAHIAIDITESMLLHDDPKIAEKLENLRQADIQLSLDDFSTGISAMSSLKKANIDYLKFDRSFIRDLETNPDYKIIAEAVVVMAQRLGLKTIAKGVETVGQRTMLEAMGCMLHQGYLYAHPMPADVFLAFVDRPKTGGYDLRVGSHSNGNLVGEC